MNTTNLSFRNLIKTLIPGFFATMSIYATIDAYISFDLIRFALNQPIGAFAIILPFSIFSGVILNTFCYVFLFPIIEKREIEGFDKFKEKINNSIIEHLYSKSRAETEFEEFKEFICIKSMILNKQNVEAIEYIKTGYWYYMEFQLNTIVMLAIMSIASIINLLARGSGLNVWVVAILIIVIILFSAMLMVFLWKAVRKNYISDQKKEMSFYYGIYQDLIK